MKRMASRYGTANLDDEVPWLCVNGGAPSLTGARKIPRQGSAGGEVERSSRFERPGQMRHAILGGRLAMTDVDKAKAEVRQRPSEATRQIAAARGIRQAQNVGSHGMHSTVRGSAPEAYSLDMSSSERTNSSVSAKVRRVIELCRATVTSLTRSLSGTFCCCIALVRSIRATSRSRTNALSPFEYSPSRRRLRRSLSNACQAFEMS